MQSSLVVGAIGEVNFISEDACLKGFEQAFFFPNIMPHYAIFIF